MSDKESDHIQNNFEYSSNSEVKETSEAPKLASKSNAIKEPTVVNKFRK